jgi:hypothetical protein
MNEKLQRNLSIALWISTIAILVFIMLQGFSGNWTTYFLILPGAPTLSQGFVLGLTNLAMFHKIMGFVTGFVSILVMVFAFISRSTVFVRAFAVVGFVIVALAAMGGFLFVISGFQDRWALGQMADAFVGAFAAYFLQLFLMNKTPRFHWTSRAG